MEPDSGSRVFVDQKGGKGSTGRAGRPKKRVFGGNRFRKSSKSSENSSASRADSETTTSKKLRRSADSNVNIDDKLAYKIIEFTTVFSALSLFLKCKECNSDVKFSDSSVRGLGFKLLVICEECEMKEINSCPLVDNHAYEVNRRSVFAMRMLGLGHSALRLFCGLMDLPKCIGKTMYDRVLKQIGAAVSTVCDKSLQRAVNVEKSITAEKDNLGDVECVDLTVSGDGSWRKRGHNSKQGVVSLIGYYSGMVVDIIVKNTFCMICCQMEKFCGTDQYEAWIDDHIEECKANHDGSSGRMEQEGLMDMFRRSLEKYGVRYRRYVGDGDSSAYASLRDNQPYGEEHPVEKRECIGHVQKRMGSRLRKKKKSNAAELNRQLTASLIDELTVYYGKAIRENSQSAEDMKKAVWATFYHKISTNAKPQHHFCPPGADSWCTWQKAKAEKKLKKYEHKKPLPVVVQNALKPVYEDLTSDDLLKRCEGGFTQNPNESLNQKIWKLAPKHLYSGVETVDIAAKMAAVTFNDGAKGYLQAMIELGCAVGQSANQYCAEEDCRRAEDAAEAALQNTKEARAEARKKLKELEEQQRAEEGAVYAAGMAD